MFEVESDRPVLLPWRNPRATHWDAYHADLEQAVGGRLGRIDTAEDIEIEVTHLQSSMETSFKNNCQGKTH